MPCSIVLTGTIDTVLWGLVIWACVETLRPAESSDRVCARARRVHRLLIGWCLAGVIAETVTSVSIGRMGLPSCPAIYYAWRVVGGTAAMAAMAAGVQALLRRPAPAG
jgi:hypothetical protein